MKPIINKIIHSAHIFEFDLELFKQNYKILLTKVFLYGRICIILISGEGDFA